MTRTPIHTPRAPQAIGTYSQAIRAGDTVYLSGQIPLDPTRASWSPATWRCRCAACSRT